MSSSILIISSVVLLTSITIFTMAFFRLVAEKRDMERSLTFPHRQNLLDQQKKALLDEIAQWIIKETNLDHDAEYKLLREQIDSSTVWIFDETIPREHNQDTTRVTARGNFHWSVSGEHIKFSIPWTITCQNVTVLSPERHVKPDQIWILPDWKQATVQTDQDQKPT